MLRPHNIRIPDIELKKAKKVIAVFLVQNNNLNFVRFKQMLFNGHMKVISTRENTNPTLHYTNV